MYLLAVLLVQDVSARIDQPDLLFRLGHLRPVD